jgi:hypothetical protein
MVGVVGLSWIRVDMHLIIVVVARDDTDVEEAGPALLLAGVGLPEEVLLSVAGHLRSRPGGDEVLGDASPVPFAQLLQTVQELPVLLLCPWNPWRA